MSSSDDPEDSKSNDSSEEDEEEGGEGRGSPVAMLHRGVLCSRNNESIFNPRVDGELEELLLSSLFWLSRLWLSQLLVWGLLV